MADTVDVNRNLDKFFTQSSVAPIGTKDNPPVLQGSTLKTIDSNPNYYKDSLGKCSNNSVEQILIKLKETAEGQKIPPEDVKEIVGDLYQLRDKTTAVGVRFDDMLMAAYKDQITLDKFMSNVQEELYNVKRTDLKGVHEERLKELDKLIKKMKSSKAWNVFGKVFGVIAALAGGIATIGTGGLAAVLGVALIAVTFANTVDNAFGDPVKKAIGNKVTDGTDSKVEAFAQWFDLGIGVLQLVLGLGAAAASISIKAAAVGEHMATAGQKAFKAGMNIATGVTNAGKAVTTLGEGASNYNVDRTKATLLEKEMEAKGDDQDLKEIMDSLRRALKQYNTHHQSMSQVAQMQLEAARWIR